MIARYSLPTNLCLLPLQTRKIASHRSQPTRHIRDSDRDPFTTLQVRPFSGRSRPCYTAYTSSRTPLREAKLVLPFPVPTERSCRVQYAPYVPFLTRVAGSIQCSSRLESRLDLSPPAYFPPLIQMTQYKPPGEVWVRRRDRAHERAEAPSRGSLMSLTPRVSPLREKYIVRTVHFSS